MGLKKLGGSADRIDSYTWFLRGEYEGVVRTVFLVVGNRETAVDITQEAFARLYGHWRKVSKYDRPDAWVRHVAVRLAIQNVRKQRIRDALTPPPEDRATQIDPTIWDVREAVAQLPPTQRAAVALFYFEDRPSSEIAEILDCSESTVRVHLHKARKKLSQTLGDWKIHAR